MSQRFLDDRNFQSLGIGASLLCETLRVACFSVGVRLRSGQVWALGIDKEAEGRGAGGRGEKLVSLLPAPSSPHSPLPIFKD